MSKLTVNEKAIEKQILSFLALKGVFAFKVESQGTFDAKIGRYRMKSQVHKVLGVADIIGVIDGQFFAIEVKSATGRLSVHQRLFLSRILSEGGIALVARSIEDVISGLKL